MERFWSKVDKNGAGGCWLFSLVSITTGYGQITIDGRTKQAHRVSYELANGSIPEGLVVRHKCRSCNCVNPIHLELGTPSDNAFDKYRDGTMHNGDKHYSRINPEKLARGERHGSKTKPEALIRGDEWRNAHAEHTINQSGVNNYHSFLTEDDIREIRRLGDLKELSHKTIGKMFNLSRPSTSKIIRRNSYKNII